MDFYLIDSVTVMIGPELILDGSLGNARLTDSFRTRTQSWFLQYLSGCEVHTALSAQLVA